MYPRTRPDAKTRGPELAASVHTAESHREGVLDNLCPPARCFSLAVPAHTLDGGEIEMDRLYISRRDIPI